ncbi:MAG: glutathione S-transferase family protein, partial [Methylocella sp.]
PAKPHSPEVNAIHPLGKVPAMRHGQFQLFESKAIVTYADMNLLPTLAYLRDLPEGSEILAGAKELTRYFERHSERASFKTTVPPPFSELRPSRMMR